MTQFLQGIFDLAVIYIYIHSNPGQWSRSLEKLPHCPRLVSKHQSIPYAGIKAIGFERTASHFFKTMSGMDFTDKSQKTITDAGQLARDHAHVQGKLLLFLFLQKLTRYFTCISSSPCPHCLRSLKWRNVGLRTFYSWRADFKRRAWPICFGRCQSRRRSSKCTIVFFDSMI